MSEAQDATQTHQDANLTAAPDGVASVPTVDPRTILATHTYAPADPWMPGERPPPICAACYAGWRGDAATGGCEAVLLAREIVALRERAERLEAEREDRLDFGRLMVQRYSLEVSGPLLEEADARVALLEGLLREVLGWIEPMWQDPRDPALRKVLRRIHAALADGG